MLKSILVIISFQICVIQSETMLATSPKRPIIDDSTGDNDESDSDSYPTCGANEVYDICPRLCPPRRCDVDERIIRCGENPKPGDPKCEPGCRCADNYYRNNEGDCVTKKECPKCFQKNEVYACRRSDPQTCETIDEEYEPIKNKKHCKRECRCKDGFYRNNIGECISKKNCLKCSGPHEYFSCGSACDNVCDTIHLQNQTNCPIKNVKCNSMCYCEYGYARDDNNICVPIAECPPKCNGQNEVYECKSSCPQTCETIGEKCKSKHISKRDCKRECRCKKGYYRNKLGDCISKKNCLKCSGPHEYFSCGGACDNVCSTLHLQNQTSCPIVNIVCNKMCYCEEGYARDENNICVPIEDCPPVCPVNEVYDICPRLCPPRICGVDKRQYKCAKSPEPGDPRCKPGCRCADNFYRNKDGVCVTKKECQKCTGKNEVYECRSSKPQTCETIDDDYEPIKKTKNCKPVCQCKEGYYRNKIGECISKENCLKCNGPHEYFTCGSACDNVCATLQTQNQTNCPIKNKTCNKKCYCEEGYARDKNNICVPIEKCPPICGINEVYDICLPTCPPQRCDVNIAAISCAPNPMPGDPDCIPGCRCADDHVRNDAGICIPRDECPTCGVNEVYDICPALCPPRSCDVDDRTIDCAPNPLPGDPECNPGCRCADNYYRNDVGVCVTREECPLLIECGKNEIASRCANGGCRKLSCAVPVKVCAKIPIGYCQEGCVCKENYLRADNGTCVLESECPPVCGLHEVYDDCPPTCPPQRCDVDNRLIKCRRTPMPGDPECQPGCRCEDDYYRNENGVCVTRDECPPLIQCGENEYASSCANGGCRKVSCARPQIRCVKLKEGGCKEGCLCIDNYLRAENGTCIPEEECPPVCGINEVYDICPPICPQARCDVDKSLILCKPNPEPGDPECNPGCRCADNFYKNNEGVCVPWDECPPPIECGLNEEYSTCANGGCRRYSCNMTGILCIDLREGACRPGCICKDQYTRSDDGICIPEKECPKICGPNEEYRCDNTCSKTCNIVDGKCAPPVKSKICKLECYCKDGYKRNKKGKCVTECDDVTEETTDGLTAFEQGNIEFTEQFLITSSKNNPNESVIGSPFSVLFLLAQLALYAVGEAKTQLLNLLHLNNDCEIRTTVPKYFKLIAETNNASFDLAQKIYGSDKYPFSKKFKKDSGEIFNAEAQNVDFAKPEEAAEIINKWVAEKTHNLINNLVSPDSLSADTRLVLAIAIYFIGDWKRQFKASNTRSLPFYSGKTNDEVQVKMMNQVGSFKYAVIDGVQVLQMPYTVPDISFVACLPKSKTGVKKLIKKLKKSSFIKRTLSELKSTTVDVSIPTLDISTTTDLKQVLIDTGVDAIFDPATAGLSGILENPEEIFVTSAVQKAKLLLNETGTQAAAATAITITRMSSVIEPVASPIKFNADHPFIYYIICKKIPVFAGIYVGPE